ncbi:MAG: CotY/CotZ family spore coat protein [Bacilli bacterium]|nr:CotY/CotZ family spore coat protein [Bacilli bacterium]
MSIEKCDCDGLRGILRVILLLQERACEKLEVLNTCDKPFLGPCTKPIKCNTRPVMLFTKCGTPWEIPYCDLTKLSSIFRLEKLDHCTATFRVLASISPSVNADHDDVDVNLKGNKKKKLIATDSFFTINIDCICAIKCLKDTFIEDVCCNVE